MMNHTISLGSSNRAVLETLCRRRSSAKGAFSIVGNSKNFKVSNVGND